MRYLNIISAVFGVMTAMFLCPRGANAQACAIRSVVTARTVIDNDTVVLTCLSPTWGGSTVYEEQKNGKMIGMIQLFDANQAFEQVKQGLVTGCEQPDCESEIKDESWISQYGTNIKTPVYIFKDSRDPAATELHQMFRKFGQAAVIYNAPAILSTGVVP